MRSYRTGVAPEMTRSAAGNLMPGDRVTVMETEPDSLVVKLADGQWKKFDPHRCYERFEVHQPETIALAKGDRIQITKNRRSGPAEQRVSNGTFHTVIGFTPQGDIKLNDGVVLPKEFKDLTHGYAATSFVAQGKTVTRVFIAESPEVSRPARGSKFYTAMSRGVKEPRIFTNDREELFDAVMAFQRAHGGAGFGDQAREPARPVEPGPQHWPPAAVELPSPFGPVAKTRRSLEASAKARLEKVKGTGAGAGT